MSSATINANSATAINATSLGTLTTSSSLTLGGATSLLTSLTSLTTGNGFTINGTSYVRIGDTAIPTTATSDDDLFVEGVLETGGQATISGNLTLAGGARSIQSTDNNTLTLGGVLREI